MATDRQQAWARAAQEEATKGNEVTAAMFSLLAMPNVNEGLQHSCREHSVGFSREGRRGFKCGIDGQVIKWIDPEPCFE